jgi:hypothetical protein
VTLPSRITDSNSFFRVDGGHEDTVTLFNVSEGVFNHVREVRGERTVFRGTLILIIHILYHHGETTCATRTDLSGCGTLGSPFRFHLQSAGVTAGGASRHADLFRLPVHFGVVFSEPGETQNEILLAQLRNCKLGVLGMAIIAEDQVGDLLYGASFVRSAVDIEDRDRPC